MTEPTEGLAIRWAGFRGDELEFTHTTDEGNKQYSILAVHPWDRADGRSVYLELAIVDENGDIVYDGDGEQRQNTIINREEFVAGLRAVFPEL